MFRRPATALAAALSAAALLLLPSMLGYGIIDDAYISLRYAHHLAAGDGLVFNPGERVEGYSNFLWTVLLAVPLSLDLPGPAAAVVLGQVCGISALLMAGRLYRRLAPLTASAGPVYLALSLASPWLCYLASGLEVGLYAALLMATMLCMVDRARAGEPGPARLACAGLLLAGASMTRPEAPLLALFHVAYLALSGAGPLRARLQRGAWLGGPFALLFGAFIGFRFHYYGELLPNTYYAKVGAPSGQLLHVGGAYAGRFLLLGGGVLFLLLVALTPQVRRRHGVGYLLGFVLTHVASVVLEGGDHMALYRFFAPVMPIFAVVTALSVEALLVRVGVSGQPRAGRLCASLTVLASLCGSAALALSTGPGGQSQHARATIEVTLAEQWSVFGRWLVGHSAPDDLVALLPIGAIGFHSQRPILDMVGLTDAHIAHQALGTGDDAFLGHEKFDNDYVLARAPRFVLAHHFVANSEPVSEAVYRETAHYPVHRALLARPDFHARYMYRLVPDGPGRFFFFYERRGAP